LFGRNTMTASGGSSAVADRPPASLFVDPQLTSLRRDDTQYFEIFGNRAIYQDGLMASTTPIAAVSEREIYDPGVAAPSALLAAFDEVQVSILLQCMRSQ
jgi:hypothetical protein